MAIEDNETYASNTVETATERTAELAARLAPAEEQQRAAATSGSQSGNFKVSKVFLDEAEATSRLLRPHPVILFILGVALAFILFIAYLISVTPADQ